MIDFILKIRDNSFYFLKKTGFNNYKIKQRANIAVIILSILTFRVHGLTHFQNNNKMHFLNF